MGPRSVCSSFTLKKHDCVIVFGGEIVPSERGHAGAGGFENDVVAIDATTGDPIEATMASNEVPRARGWASAATLNDMEGILFGGLAGDDDAPERLGDAWVLSVR